MSDISTAGLPNPALDALRRNVTGKVLSGESVAIAAHEDTPTLATFVRDRLAEWLDGLGHEVTDCDDRDGFPCLTVETWDGAMWDDVAVTSDGRTMSMVDGWHEVTLRGFVWQAEPTDTGVMHGPRQEANQDGPVCASWYVDGLAAGGQTVRDLGHRVPGTTRTV